MSEASRRYDEAVARNRQGLLGFQDWLTNLLQSKQNPASNILDKQDPRDVGISPDNMGDPATGMLYPNVTASGITPRNTPNVPQQHILDIVRNSGDFTYDADRAAGRGMPTSPAPRTPTTTGRVQRKAAPTQPVEPQAGSMYYYDPGNGSPTIAMGRHLPQGMKIGQQQGGGYISAVPIPQPTNTMQKIFQGDFSGGNKPAQSTAPLPPSRPKDLNAPPAQRPAPEVASKAAERSIESEPNFGPSAIYPTENAAGGAIHSADRVAKEKATPCHSGIINMAVGGRTDHIPMHVLEGSYVLPADIVSGLGEGNTLAGSKILDNMFHSGPYGQKIPEARANPKFPAAPPVQSPGTTTTTMPRAAGGRSVSMNSKPVPIVAAGGEYVVHPEVVTRLGKGDMNAGHEYLDNFVKYVRAQTAKTLQNLPGPRKD